MVYSNKFALQKHSHLIGYNYYVTNYFYLIELDLCFDIIYQHAKHE